MYAEFITHMTSLILCDIISVLDMYKLFVIKSVSRIPLSYFAYLLNYESQKPSE